ncbi:MAG: hypothetical protein II710_05340 [Clostridia bacterium]|nr:hypothetical protein [Clostridia bacterium]
MLSAVKRSEDGTGLVVRLYETTGKAAAVTVSGDILPVPLTDTVTPWSVETWYLANSLTDGAAEWKKVLLTEYEM